MAVYEQIEIEKQSGAFDSMLFRSAAVHLLKRGITPDAVDSDLLIAIIKQRIDAEIILPELGHDA